ATIVSSDRKARKPKSFHDDYHVLRHGALRIWRVVRSRGRATTTSITTQIGAHDGEVAGKQRADPAPHQGCLPETRPKEDRQPGSGPAHKDTGLACLQLGSFERIHHCRPSEFSPGQPVTSAMGNLTASREPPAQLLDTTPPRCATAGRAGAIEVLGGLHC